MTIRDSRMMAVLALLAVTSVAGCAGSSSTDQGATESAGISSTAETATGEVTLEQARAAGAVARAIEAEPNRFAEILTEHGMTAEGFESLLFAIAEDPALSAAYEQARASSSG